MKPEPADVAGTARRDPATITISFKGPLDFSVGTVAEMLEARERTTADVAPKIRG